MCQRCCRCMESRELLMNIWFTAKFNFCHTTQCPVENALKTDFRRYIPIVYMPVLFHSRFITFIHSHQMKIKNQILSRLCGPQSQTLQPCNIDFMFFFSGHNLRRERLQQVIEISWMKCNLLDLRCTEWSNERITKVNCESMPCVLRIENYDICVWFFFHSDIAVNYPTKILGRSAQHFFLCVIS